MTIQELWGRARREDVKVDLFSNCFWVLERHFWNRSAAIQNILNYTKTGAGRLLTVADILAFSILDTVQYASVDLIVGLSVSI